MRKSPWVPLLLGVSLIVLSTLTSVLYPETLELSKLRSVTRAGGDAVDPTDSDDLADEPDMSILQKTMAKAREDLAEVWRFILGNKRIMFLMLSVGFFSVGRFVQEMLLQYASKRYGWTWDEVRTPVARLLIRYTFADADGRPPSSSLFTGLPTW